MVHTASESCFQATSLVSRKVGGFTLVDFIQLMNFELNYRHGGDMGIPSFGISGKKTTGEGPLR